MAKNYVETKSPWTSDAGRHVVRVNKHVDNLNGGEVAGFSAEAAAMLVGKGHGVYVVPEDKAAEHEAAVKAAEAAKAAEASKVKVLKAAEK